MTDAQLNVLPGELGKAFAARRLSTIVFANYQVGVSESGEGAQGWGLFGWRDGPGASQSALPIIAL